MKRKDRFNPFNKKKIKEIEDTVNSIYPGIQMYARDVNLDPFLTELYEKDMIIKELGFTDCSHRFMGMVTSTRYVILSNHMKDLSSLEDGTNWGLCVANKGAHFKVLGIHEHNGKTGIFLLHLPDDDGWELWKEMRFSTDNEIYEMAVERFDNKCELEPVIELTKEDWLNRCKNPLGMNNMGNFFPIEE